MQLHQLATKSILCLVVSFPITACKAGQLLAPTKVHVFGQRYVCYLVGVKIRQRVTHVSSRHSQKCVTLLKFRTELNINLLLLGPIFLGVFCCWKFLIIISSKPFKLFQNRELVLCISYHLTYILIKLTLNSHTNCLSALYDRDIFFFFFF